MVAAISVVLQRTPESFEMANMYPKGGGEREFIMEIGLNSVDKNRGKDVGVYGKIILAEVGRLNRSAYMT